MTELNFAPNTFVVLRCVACGDLVSFNPVRVLHLSECRCGNDNWGSPKFWGDKMFGDFSFIRTEHMTFGLRLG